MTPSAPSSLLMVRHGQSTWNAQKRWQGQADPPLSDFGRHQATVASRAIGSVELIVSSPQIRALETASIIAEHIGVGPVQTHPDLREREVGEWSGLTGEEIERDYPGWLDSGRRPPHWEQEDAFTSRVLGAIDSLVANYNESTMLVVAHGGVILAVEDHLEVREGRIPNLHGRIVHHHHGTLSAGERLELIPSDLSTGGTGLRN